MATESNLLSVLPGIKVQLQFTREEMEMLPEPIKSKVIKASIKSVCQKMRQKFAKAYGMVCPPIEVFPNILHTHLQCRELYFHYCFYTCPTIAKSYCYRLLLNGNNLLGHSAFHNERWFQDYMSLLFGADADAKVQQLLDKNVLVNDFQQPVQLGGVPVQDEEVPPRVVAVPEENVSAAAAALPMAEVEMEPIPLEEVDTEGLSISSDMYEFMQRLDVSDDMLEDIHEA